MRYKSILFDVDGTLVPVGPNTAPSDKVVESIKLAKNKVAVSLVSGRSLNWLTDLFRVLDLTDPCIINGGSQIIEPETKKILWERPIGERDVTKILEIVRRDKIPFLVSDNGVEHENPSNSKFLKPLAIKLTYFDSKEKSDQCLNALFAIPNISAHKTFSWDKNRNYRMEVYITHKEATKQHAVQELARLLGIETREMIGVGDARNDIPLLNVCGLRIAMGNADEKLKMVADYIVPSVDKDGVCEVVDKFILSENDVKKLRMRRNSFAHFINKFINLLSHH